MKFPPGFLWGAATAAHQVEGGLQNDWHEFERRPGAIKGGDTSWDGVDHRRRFDEDFSLAEGMGHNAHRLSIEWSRLEPEPGAWDVAAVAHYHDVFAAMRRRGLEPLVTLHHFTNPEWVARQGGWLTPGTAEAFGRFAAKAAREFGREVRTWITLNEPNVYTYQAHAVGAFPPGGRSVSEAMVAYANLALGHARAYHAIHEAFRDLRSARVPRVGIAQNLAVFEPHSRWNPFDRAMAAACDRIFNRVFLEAVTTGRARFHFPGARGVTVNLSELRHGALDFLGVNYYTRAHCDFPGGFVVPEHLPMSDLGWEIYPTGFHRCLRLADTFSRKADGRRIPILITENGIDDRSGMVRPHFLVHHLEVLHRAVCEGIDVRGYMHWTLMDNFEWAEGYAPRFGLYRIDRDDGFARVETPAVAVYRDIASQNAITRAISAEYGCERPIDGKLG